MYFDFWCDVCKHKFILGTCDISNNPHCPACHSKEIDHADIVEFIADAGKSEKRKREEAEEQKTRVLQEDQRDTLARQIAKGNVERVKTILGIHRDAAKQVRQGKRVAAHAQDVELSVLAEPDAAGNTLLHWLPQTHQEIFDILLSTDADGRRLFIADVNAANAQNLKGQTRAHFCESKEDVEMLAGPTPGAFGIKFDVIDNDGRTPSQYVQEKLERIPREIKRLRDAEYSQPWHFDEIFFSSTGLSFVEGWEPKDLTGLSPKEEATEKGRFTRWRNQMIDSLRKKEVKLPGAKEALVARTTGFEASANEAALSFQAHVNEAALRFHPDAGDAALLPPPPPPYTQASQPPTHRDLADVVRTNTEAGAREAPALPPPPPPFPSRHETKDGGNSETHGVVRLIDTYLDWEPDFSGEGAERVHLELTDITGCQQSKLKAKLRVTLHEGNPHTFDLTDPADIPRSLAARDHLRDALQLRLAILDRNAHGT